MRTLIRFILVLLGISIIQLILFLSYVDVIILCSITVNAILALALRAHLVQHSSSLLGSSSTASRSVTSPER